MARQTKSLFKSKRKHRDHRGKKNRKYDPKRKGVIEFKRKREALKNKELEYE